MIKLLLKDSFQRKSKLFIYLIFCSIGLWLMFYPTLLSGFSALQTDPGDTRLVNYFLEHSFKLLAKRNYVGGLWSPTFFYPYKNVLAFSENLFGSAPIYWFFRSFFSADLAFQLWMFAVCVLNFVSFAFLMRRYQVNHVLSALGAFLFAFSLPRIGHLGHQQLLSQFFTPLVFLIAWEFVKKPTRKRLTLLLLLSYLQVLAGIYIGWFLLFSLALFFGIAYGLDSQARTKVVAYWQGDYKAIIAITLGWVALMLLTLFPYLEAKSVFGARPYAEIDSMLPRIASWFSVPPDSLWSSLLGWVSKDLPMEHEHYMFSGFIILLLTGLSIYTLFWARDVLTSERAWIIRVCLLVFVTIFCLSLRLPFGVSLWRIVYEVVPGASVIRAVTRIWTVSYFYLLVATLLSFDSLLHTVVTEKRSRLVIVSILCLIGVSEQIVFNLPSYEKKPYIKQEAELRQLMKKGCDVAYVSLNPEVPFFVDQLSVMWAGIKANVPVVNGYSGNIPPRYGDITKSLDTAKVVHWLEPVTRKTPKRLCMLYPKLLVKSDLLISAYAVKSASKISENFVAHTLKLPITPVFSQDIKFFDIPQTVEPKSVIKSPIIVKNTSNFFWSRKGENLTAFSYRWIDSMGKTAIFEGDGDRTRLPSDVAPGETLALNAVIKTPKIPGKYQLILTMVQENVAWFYSVSNAPYPKIPIEVVAQ